MWSMELDITIDYFYKGNGIAYVEIIMETATLFSQHIQPQIATLLSF